MTNLATVLSAQHVRKPRALRGARPQRDRVERMAKRPVKAVSLIDGAPRWERQRQAEWWLDHVTVPDRVAALVLDDAARRWAISGICRADPALVSDVVPAAAAYWLTLRLLEAVGLITLTPADDAGDGGTAWLIVPVVGASVSPAAWRETAIAISRPKHLRARR